MVADTLTKYITFVVLKIPQKQIEASPTVPLGLTVYL